MRFRRLQSIADSQTDNYKSNLWQPGRCGHFGSLGRMVLPPATSDAPATAE
jgi:hypothetical protein